MENKGEEAIIRGVIDIVFPDADCEYHIVDNNSRKYYKIDNIHIHPGSLFFSNWRSKEFRLGLSWHQLYSSACSLTRNGLNKFFPWWILKPHKEARNLKSYLSGEKRVPIEFKESIEQLKKVKYIIAGHNGGLDEYVCHLINELYKINIRYGIFGSSMKPGLNNLTLLNLYRTTFNYSEFNIARNPIGYNWAISKFPNIKFELKPDPAFGMNPCNSSSIDILLKKFNLDDFFNKPVVMFTTAEPAPIARHSFDENIGTSKKINAHRIFLSEFLKKIYSNCDINILFLPHTIGPTVELDDRNISRDVIQRANLVNDKRVKLIEADLTAKELKGLIGRADFLVAERIHSIIGAIGVETPFMCFGSKHDNRVKGILDMQMKLPDKIFYLSKPDIDSAYEKFKYLFGARIEDRRSLRILNESISKEFNEVVPYIRNKIYSNR